MRPDIATQKELAEVDLTGRVERAGGVAVARERAAIAGRREQRGAEAKLQPLPFGFPSLYPDVEPQVTDRHRRITDATATNAFALRIVAVDGQQVDRQRHAERQTLQDLRATGEVGDELPLHGIVDVILDGGVIGDRVRP